MSNDETNGSGRILPKPVALTPEQVQEIAARTAAGFSGDDLWGLIIKMGLKLVPNRA